MAYSVAIFISAYIVLILCVFFFFMSAVYVTSISVSYAIHCKTIW
jgi:hypothetical protein